jgi:cell division protease FtsH
MEKKHQFNVGYLFIAMWMVILVQSYIGPASKLAHISYDQFVEYLIQGHIKRVQIDEQYIRGEFSTSMDGKETFVTPRLDIDLAEQLAQYDVEYTGVVRSNFLSNLLSWLAPVFFFLVIWLFVFRKFAEKQGMGGLMNIGKSRAKVMLEKNTGVTFADVAGVDEAKGELEEVVHFLQDPEHYSRLGAHIPKGVLLVGPPGTGKTLLARAVAGEAKVSFFSISGSEFIEMFVGVGAARVRDLFEQAKLQAPAIIFIDELDALGRARGFGPASGGHDEREQTLNQLLAEMDGFNPADGVIILAATNRPEILDAALLRAGRFDRQVLVDRPDKIGREQILRVHLKKINAEENLDIDTIASLTTGFSGADIANLVNEAALFATRHNANSVNLDDFINAIERLVAGLEKRNRLINAHEKNVVAHHEMGHALVGMLLDKEQAVQKVSIIPRGIGSLGYTIQRPSDDRYLMNKEELENRLAVLLAGRAAEILIFQQITTGAADDLAKATDLAKSMVMRYGMSDDVGLLSLESQKPLYLNQQQADIQPDFGPDMSNRIMTATSLLLDEAMTKASTILKNNVSLLKDAAQLLLNKETLDEKQLNELKVQIKE